MATLRALPVDALIGAEGMREIQPVIDGALFTEAPIQAFAHGHAANIALLAGTNSG